MRLTEAEAAQLRCWATPGPGSLRRARRAQIVLLAAEGWTNQYIAASLKLHPETVALWRRRFLSNRLEGVRMDAPRSGRRTDGSRLPDRILRSTRRLPNVPGERWTTPTHAKRLRVSHMPVSRTWRRHSRVPPVQPIGATEGAPTDPVEMEGVFLRPPQRAAVFQVPGPAPPALSVAKVETGPAGKGPASPLAPELVTLFQRWREASSRRTGPIGCAAELLVFLRMVERRGPAATSFVVLYDGFPRAAEQRVLRWTRVHPQFQPVRVPAGVSWFGAVERYLGEEATSAARGPAPPEGLRPVTESLAQYLRSHPSTSPPFVWTSPELERSAGPAPPS